MNVMHYSVQCSWRLQSTPATLAAPMPLPLEDHIRLFLLRNKQIAQMKKAEAVVRSAAEKLERAKEQADITREALYVAKSKARGMPELMNGPQGMQNGCAGAVCVRARVCMYGWVGGCDRGCVLLSCGVGHETLLRTCHIPLNILMAVETGTMIMCCWLAGNWGQGLEAGGQTEDGGIDHDRTRQCTTAHHNAMQHIQNPDSTPSTPQHKAEHHNTPQCPNSTPQHPEAHHNTPQYITAQQSTSGHPWNSQANI